MAEIKKAIRKGEVAIDIIFCIAIVVVGYAVCALKIDHPSFTISNVQFTPTWFNATVGFSHLTDSGLKITDVHVESWTKEVNTTFYNGDSLTISVPHNGTFAHIPTYIVLGDETGGNWKIDFSVQSK